MVKNRIKLKRINSLFSFELTILCHILSKNVASYIDSIYILIFHNAKKIILKKNIFKEKLIMGLYVVSEGFQDEKLNMLRVMLL